MSTTMSSTQNLNLRMTQIGIRGAPGPKSAPRGTKSTTFAKGFFQASNLPKYPSKYLPNCLPKCLSNYLPKYLTKYLPKYFSRLQ